MFVYNKGSMPTAGCFVTDIIIISYTPCTSFSNNIVVIRLCDTDLCNIWRE